MIVPEVDKTLHEALRRFLVFHDVETPAQIRIRVEYADEERGQQWIWEFQTQANTNPLHYPAPPHKH